MASASASSFKESSGNDKEMDSLIQNLQKDAQLVTKAVEKLADDDASHFSLSYPNGISLLSLKTDVLLSYIHHLVLLVSHRARGLSLATSPGKDLVANLVRNRLVLEKIKPLQGRLRYQIEKLNKALAEEEKEKRRGVNMDGEDEEVEDGEKQKNELDPLSFRPNLSAFNASTARSREAQAERASSKSKNGAPDDSEEEESSGVYKPPKQMAVSYDPDSKRGKDRDPSKLRGRNSALLSDLTSGLSSNPYEVSSGGVGVGGANRGAGMSKRERELKELQEYEEDNYTRLTMSKKDSKKRRRDEEDLALGGAGLSGATRKQGRIGAGMEEEFGDLLRGSEKNYGKKSKRGGGEDAYETLRMNHKVGLKGTLGRARGNEKSSSNANGVESIGLKDRKGKSKFDRQKKDIARGKR